MRFQDVFAEPLVGNEHAKRAGEVKRRLVLDRSMIQALSLTADKEGKADAREILNEAARAITVAIRAVVLVSTPRPKRNKLGAEAREPINIGHRA